MFYRYEAKNKNGIYVGIFGVFNPDQRRYFGRFLKEPKWYSQNPGVDSRCWFTELGFQKYGPVIDEIISDCPNIEYRIIKSEHLNNIVVKGKIQCIVQLLIE